MAGIGRVARAGRGTNSATLPALEKMLPNQIILISSPSRFTSLNVYYYVKHKLILRPINMMKTRPFKQQD